MQMFGETAWSSATRPGTGVLRLDKAVVGINHTNVWCAGSDAWSIFQDSKLSKGDFLCLCFRKLFQSL